MRLFMFSRIIYLASNKFEQPPKKQVGKYGSIHRLLRINTIYYTNL